MYTLKNTMKKTNCNINLKLTTSKKLPYITCLFVVTNFKNKLTSINETQTDIGTDAANW